jgi:4-hydroxy-3-polyprenylbenzoate decarboxylase
LSGSAATPRRIIVAITGASGAAYGIRALQVLRALPGVESHLVVTKAGRATIGYETGISLSEVRALADEVHSDNDLGAAISSGSFPTGGMLVARAASRHSRASPTATTRRSPSGPPAWS